MQQENSLRLAREAKKEQQVEEDDGAYCYVDLHAARNNMVHNHVMGSLQLENGKYIIMCNVCMCYTQHDFVMYVYVCVYEVGCVMWQSIS